MPLGNCGNKFIARHTMILKNIYQHKKVFITGHTGFKGAWLTQWLHLLGAKVKGYALSPNTSDDIFIQIQGEKLCQSVIGDIRDKERLKKEILDFQPDFIFHLAAQPLVKYSYEYPIDTFNTNVMGTINLLDAIRELKNPCSIVLITTDKVYHNYEWIYPYRENDRLGGYDPYSASKACSELAIDSYKNSFFNLKDFSIHQKSIGIGRAGNVIGGGDWCKDRLVPDIIRALSKKQDIIVRNPNAIRPWQHVLEPLRGYLLLGANIYENPIKYSNPYNFGPYMHDVLNVQQVVEKAIQIWGEGKFIIPTLEKQPHEAGTLKLDISKAIEELNWNPIFNATQAIEMTINWYKEFLNSSKKNMSNFTASQIEIYLTQ